MKRWTTAALAAAVMMTAASAPAEAATWDGPSLYAPSSGNNVNTVSGPSAVVVSGQAGVISDVNVMLRFDTTGDLSYFDYLLVAPNGTAVMLASDCFSYPQGGMRLFNLFFDQSAPQTPSSLSLPLTSSGQTLTYRPRDCYDNADFNGDDFPALLPSANVTPDLRRFDGGSPNGTWRLYAGGSGSPFGSQTVTMSGWTLDLSTRVPDTTAPRITRPAVSGRTIGYTLSERATMRFTIDRAVKGLKKRSRCVARPKRSKGKACLRWKALPGQTSFASAAGTRTHRWNGKRGAKRLPPGTYRLTFRATDAAGNTSRPVAVRVKLRRR